MSHPQNPYDSYIIEASAGAGKTYQLTRRFMNLVATGAHPSSILTITFTVKAASEMKERILQEASRLLEDKERQREFERELQGFYKDFSKKKEFAVQAPLSAIETARAILAATQLLKITTIDALFYDWFSSFPWEANPFEKRFSMKSFPYELMDSIRTQEINEEAWERIFIKESQEAVKECRALLAQDPEQGILGIEKKIFEIFRHYTFLWQCEREQGEALLQYSELGSEISETDLLENIHEDLKAIVLELKNKDLFLEALGERTLKALFKSKLLNQSGELSGVYVRGKTRQKFSDRIQRIETHLESYFRVKKLKAMNIASQSLFSLYKLWLEERDLLKQKQSLIEFHDLAIGNYKLFHDAAGTGATWYLQKTLKHLMIDECQDTSFLQFSVFRKLIEEILSFEEESVPQTVFLVGDKKQSIYAFREAEPEVLTHMKGLFESFDKTCIPLHDSYRSAPLILDFVNEVFQKSLIEQKASFYRDPFPSHQTARDSNGQHILPNCSRIHIQDLDLNLEDKVSAIRAEAEYLASYLSDALSGKNPHPVYDKKTQTFRNLEASDCAILYRSSLYIEEFEEALKSKGVPYLREEKKGFFESPEIKDMMALLRFLSNQEDLISLLSFLKSPFAGISDQTLLEILEQTKSSEDRVWDFLQSPQLEKVWQFLELYMDLVHSLSPSQLIFKIWVDFGIFGEELKVPLASESAYKNLRKLHEKIFQIEGEKKHSLHEILKELERKAEKDEEAPAATKGHAVRLMTIHKAKGLEFPFVALAKSSEPWYRLDRYWAKMNVSETRGLAYVGVQKQRPKKDSQLGAVLKQTEQTLEAESERLLYVALTRASQYLLITAHANKSLESSFYPVLREAVFQKTGELEWIAEQSSQEIHKVEEKQEEFFLNYQNSEFFLPQDLTLRNPSSYVHNELLESPSLLEKKKGIKNPLLRRIYGIFVHEALSKVVCESVFDFESFFQRKLNSLGFREKKLVLSDGEFKKRCWEDLENITQTKAWSELLSNVAKIYPEFRMVEFAKSSLTVGACDLYVQKSSGEHILLEWKTADPPEGVDLLAFSHQMGFAKQVQEYARMMSAYNAKAEVHAKIWYVNYDRPCLIKSYLPS